MKQILLLACGLLMSFSAQAQSFENAKDAVKNMGVGWNLGNTLDANDASKTWTTTEQHETCWGQSVTKPEHDERGWFQLYPCTSDMVSGDGQRWQC